MNSQILEQENFRELILIAKNSTDSMIKEKNIPNLNYNNFIDIISENSEDWINKVKSCELSGDGYNYPSASYNRKGLLVFHEDIFEEFKNNLNNFNVYFLVFCSFILHEILHVYLGHKGGELFAEKEVNNLMVKEFFPAQKIFAKYFYEIEKICKKHKI